MMTFRTYSALVAASAVAAVFGFTKVASAQTAETFTGSPYSQNFDSLSGNSISALTGWYGQRALTAFASNSTAGAFYLYNNAGDKGVGAIGSNSTPGSAWGLAITNNSGSTIDTLDLALNIERFRRGSGNANDFLTISNRVVDSISGAFATDFGNSASGTSQSSNGVSGFSRIAQYNATAEFPQTGSAVAVAPVAPDNQKAKSLEISSLGWTPGSILLIRFEKNNAGGTDDGWGMDDLVLSVPAPATSDLVYSGPEGAAWSTGTTSFVPQGGGSAVAFSSGANVTFDGTAAGSVPTPDAVDPKGVTVSGGSYTFAGPGAINTSGTVAVTGGTLTLSTSLSASNGIFVNGGTLVLTSDNNLATDAAISMDGGTLSILSSDSSSNSRAVTAQGGGATISVESGVTANINALLGSGPVNKTGAGTLVASAYSVTGALSVSSGTLSLVTPGTLTINGQDGGFAGNLEMLKAGRINIIGTISGGGSVQVGDDTTPTVDLNAQNAAGSVLNTITTGTAVTKLSLSANSGQALTVGAINAGDASVSFGAVQGSSTAGQVVLTQPLNYTGATFIASAANGSVSLQVSDALPITTPVTFNKNSTSTSAATGKLNLNGNSQTLRSVASAPNATGGTIMGDPGSVLTINSQDGDDTDFRGTVTGQVSVVKTGPGFQTFSGVYTTTGNLTVSGGKLTLPANAAASYTQTVAATNLTVNGGTLVIPNFTGGLPAVVLATNASVSNTSGLLDLGNNDLIATGGGIDALRSAAQAWYGNSSSGLGSTTADKTNTTIVLFSNNDAGNPFYSTYDGVGLDSNSVIAKYSYVGDTNLDGVLDANDASNIIEALSTGVYSYSADTNFDGVIDATDYANFAAAFANYTTPIGNGQGGGSGGGSIPEPTSLAMLLPATALISRRRR